MAEATELSLLTVLLMAAAAAAASVGGGLAALFYRPTTLVMSMTFGFAAGLLLGTVGLEMLPQAVELADVFLAGAGFVAGFGTIYGMDLFVHRGRLAGDESEMYGEVARFHRRRRPRGGEAAVLAAGTMIEELVEGIAIGVGALIEPRLAILIAVATAVDNATEGLNIGQLYRSEERPAARRRSLGRILGWTALIGLNDLLGASLGWSLLRDAPDEFLGFVFAVGGGGMFYIAITDLVPISQERQYQQSAGLASAAGFLLALAL